MSSPGPLVCFIVPVYNGEQFLRECLDSILGQTYGHWICRIYDNQSTDGSPGILNSYAQKDSRIRVVRGDVFLKSLDSLNRSMELIDDASEFCKVLHADDLLYPECLDKMLECASRHPTAGVICSYRMAGTTLSRGGLDREQTFWKGEEMARLTLRGWPALFGSPSTLLLRSDLLRNRKPFYPVEDIHADTLAVYEMLSKSDFAFVHQILSFTREHGGSVTSWCERVQSIRALRLHCMIHYGRQFLAETEWRERFSLLRNEYLDFVATHRWKCPVWTEQGKELHAYHAEKMRQLELEMGIFRLLRGLVLFCMDMLLAPLGYRHKRRGQAW